MLRLTLITAIVSGAAGLYAGWDWRGAIADADMADYIATARDAQDEQRRIDERRASTAAGLFEAQRRAREQEHAKTRAELREALEAPVACTIEAPGQPATVGDVVVPRSAIRRLRDAAGQTGSAADTGKPAPAVPGSLAIPGF